MYLSIRPTRDVDHETEVNYKIKEST